jgi:uncharacterized protein
MGQSHALAGHRRGTPWGFWATLGFSALVMLSWFFTQVGVLSAFVVVAAIQAAMGNSNALGDSASMSLFVKDLANDGLFLGAVTIVSGIVGSAVTIYFASLRQHLSVRDYLGLKLPKLGQFTRWLLLSIVSFFAIAHAINALRLVSRSPRTSEFLADAHKHPESLPVLFIAVVLIAPLFEECLFRGFMLSGLKKSRLGAAGAVLLTAIAWAVIHLQYDVFDMGLIFVMGLILGIAQIKTRSLYIPFAIHVANNLIAMLAVIFAAGR